ncbi:MAG TPA: alpha/beta fold hydrolase [Actinomycetota bacterium]|nr:alpha/beta fold hydrolase [Actinomycetota bacterium]
MEPIRFTTADGLTLEGEVRRAESRARGTAVLCHPHPRHGGSKDHPLLWTIRNDLAARRGATVVTFNSRGIMGSEGSFGSGIDERQDLAAAIDVARRLDGGPTLVVGWSFGANLALCHAVSDPRIAGLALIGLPVAGIGPKVPDLPPREALRGLRAPVLLISGAADQFSPAPELRSLARKIGTAEVEVVPDSGHFFERRERWVAEQVGSFAERVLG